MAAKIAFVPSPVVQASESTPLSECLGRMREGNVGAILVVRADGSLTGIFTERDLLAKIDRIAGEGLWKRPIREVMTSPVRTIDASELSKARQLMLDRGIRHLPVTSEEKGKTRIVGVVSIRDLFESSLAFAVDAEAGAGRSGPPALARVATRAVELGVLSRDASVSRFLRDSLSTSPYVVVKKLVPPSHKLGSEPLTSLYKLRAIVFDIDRMKAEHWSNTLASLSRDPEIPFVAVVHDPLLHDPGELSTLEKLKDGKRFAVFAKPVNVSALLSTLSARL